MFFFSNLSSRWSIGNHLNINLHVRQDKRTFLESCFVQFTYMISISKCDNLRIFFLIMWQLATIFLQKKAFISFITPPFVFFLTKLWKFTKKKNTSFECPFIIASLWFSVVWRTLYVFIWIWTLLIDVILVFVQYNWFYFTLVMVY